MGAEIRHKFLTNITLYIMSVQILDCIEKNSRKYINQDWDTLATGYITLDRVIYGSRINNQTKVVIDCYIPPTGGFSLGQAEGKLTDDYVHWLNYFGFGTGSIHWQYPVPWAGVPNLVINLYDGNPEHYEWTSTTKPNPNPIYLPGRRTITIYNNTDLTVSGVGNWHYSRNPSDYTEGEVRPLTIGANPWTRLYSIKWYEGETQIDEYLPAIQNGNCGLYSTYTDTMFAEYLSYSWWDQKWNYYRLNPHRWGPYNGFGDIFPDATIETLNHEMYTGGIGPFEAFNIVDTVETLQTLISNEKIYIGQIVSVVDDGSNNGVYHIVPVNNVLTYKKLSFAQ